MKSGAETGPAELARGWAAGRFHRVYLFAGPDVLTKDEALADLRSRFLGADEGGINVDAFDGNEAGAGPVLSAAATLPFFGGRRLVVLRRAELLPAAEAGLLADGLPGLPESNCLVLLSEDKPDPRSVLAQAVRSVGASAVFWPPFENQLAGWVSARAQKAGKRMDRAAAQALVDGVGPSMGDLAQEIEKLALYVKDRPAVNEADVEALRGGRAGLKFMEWERAVWRRERGRALSLLEVLREMGETSSYLLPQLARALQKLLLAKALRQEGSSPDEVCERFRLRARDVRADFQDGLSRWTWDDLQKALEETAAADAAAKSGSGAAEADFTRLVWRLTRASPLLGASAQYEDARRSTGA